MKKTIIIIFNLKNIIIQFEEAGKNRSQAKYISLSLRKRGEVPRIKINKNTTKEYLKFHFMN